MALAEETFGPFLRNAFGEPYLPDLVRETFSRTGSQAIYERSLGHAGKREKTLFLFVGSDGGLLLRFLSRLTPARSTRFLVVEFPELMALAVREGVIPSTLPKHLTVCSPQDLPTVSQKLGIEDYYRMDAILLTQSTTVELGLHQDYRQMWKDANLFLVRLKFTMYNSTGTVLNFLSQTMKNLAETRHPAHIFNDLFTGWTAVILAGGPSLAAILPWVKENRDKLVVMAVARIAHLLDREGILPEFYFSVDPYDLSFFNSRELLNAPPGPVLIGSYHMNARLLGQWTGPFCYMGTPFPWDTPLNPQGNDLFLGTTVAHQAMGVAMRMGFHRVILAGVDLCFSKEGITHSKGTLESQMGPWIPSSDLQVETNGGWLAETWYDLYYDIPSMGSMAEVALLRGCTIINPSKAAARIPNVAHIPLDEIPLTPLPDCPRQRIARTLPVENSRTRSQHYKKVIQELNRVMAEARQIRKLAEEALECNDRLFGRRGEPSDFKYKRRMDAIEEILDQRHRVMVTMVRKIKVESFLGLADPDRERVMTDAEVEEMGHKYYQYHIEGADALLELLEASRNRVSCRLEEETPRPDLHRLSRQWLADQQPGRCRLLMQRITEPPPSWQASLAELQQRFQEDLTMQDTSYRQQLHEMFTPTAVRSKIMGFFQDKNITRLRHFAEGLKGSSLEQVEQFIWLIQGCVADLENDTRKATQYFRRISLPALQEDAMRGILTIALREGDLFTARAVLARLTAMAPIFYNYYGDILRISGELSQALQAYRQLLQWMPEDPVTRIKMTRIHMELGQMAEARACLQPVVEQYPDNQAAQSLMHTLTTAPAV